MAKMKVAQVAKAGADFEIVERDIPQPGPGHVRIRVQACGVCHSDVLTKEGGWPGIVYPRVPGHEVAGVIDEAGSGVTQWKKGQRVGVGWHGGQDGTCLACRRGDFANCATLKITGLSYDGGYQEYMIAPVEAVARIPESLEAAEAAPLLCAGITTLPCATAARCRVTWWPFRGSAGSAIWEFSSRRSLATRSPPSGAGRRMLRSRGSWGRASTSTAPGRTQRQSCRSSAGHA
jgi:D-arabinose 1-dehydrogenase-like Zn-dependent alcohol dehydrogenase